MIISPSRFRVSSSSTRMIVKSYGPEGAPMVIVKECTSHTCHPQHHVLWYLFHQPTTTVSLKVTYKFVIYIYIYIYIYIKHVSQGQGRKFNLPGPYANGPPPLASTVINRIAPQGSHRYSRRGHNTIVLHTHTKSKINRNDKVPVSITRHILFLSQEYTFNLP